MEYGKLYDALADINYDASGGDSAKKISKSLQSNHPEVVDYIDHRDLIDFILNFVAALDVGLGVKHAQHYEKKLYKRFPELKEEIADYLDHYTDMEMADMGSEFETFWKRS